MIQLSTHFGSNEFETGGPIPTECLPIFERLCVEILEPVRSDFNFPLVITSGYRSPEANAEAHGQPNSEHMATTDWCACDFIGSRAVFDWMRLNPLLPFHQLILEHGQSGSSIIHVSINQQKVGVRSVLEGATHNASPYIKVDYVAYSPIVPTGGAEPA